MYQAYGPESAGLSRHPWATYSIMVICLFIQLILLFSPGPPQSIVDAMNLSVYLENAPAPPELEYVKSINKKLIYASPGQLMFSPEKREEMATQLQIALEQGKPYLDNLAVKRLGLAVHDPKPLTLFTHILFHQSHWTLLIYMAFLYFSAPWMEDRWGRTGFTIFFFGAGALSTLPLLILSHQPVYLTGAIAAIAATYGAYMWRYRSTGISTQISLIPGGWTDELPDIKPIYLFVPFLVLILGVSLLLRGFLPVLSFQMWSVLIGFGIGFSVAFILERTGWETKLYAHPYDRLSEEDKLTARVDYLIMHRKMDEALKELADGVERFPDNRDLNAQYWDQAVRCDQAHKAWQAGAARVAFDLEEGDYEAAYFHWKELADRVPEVSLPPHQVLALANGLLTHNARDQVIDVLRINLRDADRMDREDLAQMINLAAMVDPALTVEAIDSATRQGTWSTEELAELKRLRNTSQNQSSEAEERWIELSPEEPPPEIEEDPFTPTRIQTLYIVEAKPLGISAEGVVLEIKGERKRLSLTQIKALSLGAVREIGSPPFLVIDLLRQSPLEALERHVVLRFNSRTFNPKTLFPSTESAAGAIRSLVEHILDHGEIEPLPDRATLLDGAFPNYGSLADFEISNYGVSST